MIELTGTTLTIEDVVAVARHWARVAPLNENVRDRMQRSRDWVDASLRQGGKLIYGVNTGFGSLATQQIAADQARQLSRNVVLHCVCGVGRPLPAEIVRAMMTVRVNMLAKGHSGVRPIVAQTLVDMLNAGVTPVVPRKGSLGSSGDLAPLAHIAVVMTRELGEEKDGYSGQAWLGNELLSAAEAMAGAEPMAAAEAMAGAEAMNRAGIHRLILEAKEGLSLTNGMDFMSAAGAVAVHDAENLLRHAEIAAALSTEALLGLSDAFHPALHAALHTVGGQSGQQKTAGNIRTLIEGSRLIDSDSGRVQDAYTLRCIPQVLGPIRDVLAFLHQSFTVALNAATDNPLIFLDLPDEPLGRAISGGNFHGQGPAMWLDILGIALAEAASIAERRVFRLLTPELSAGLPAMLVPTSGLNSGLMMVQYTAAALVSDNKTLAHPDSVDSIPSCANQEDHVSMGANAARHALEILDNVRHVIAIELLAAAQGIDLRPDGPARLGIGTAAAYGAVRERASFLARDRATTPDIEALADLIHSRELLEAVRNAVGVDFD